MSRRQLARGESQSPETIAESEVSKERGKHEEDNLVAGETNKKASCSPWQHPSPQPWFLICIHIHIQFPSID
jgi:hypothetical protein